jgi:Carboxypeptidase regulatory-like domain
MLRFAHENEDGQLVASICSRTAAVDRAQADLAYLRSVSSSAQFGYLYGVASNGEKAVRFGQTFGPWLPPGIPGVTVTLSGLGQSRHLVTGEDGSFRFDDLSPGKYNVAVAKEGYSLRGDSAAFDVPAGGCAYAWETLVVDRRMVGKVAVADECDFSNHRPKGPLEISAFDATAYRVHAVTMGDLCYETSSSLSAAHATIIESGTSRVDLARKPLSRSGAA